MSPQLANYPESLLSRMYQEDVEREKKQKKKVELESHQNLAAARISAIHEEEMKRQVKYKERNEERKRRIMVERAEMEKEKARRAKALAGSNPSLGADMEVERKITEHEYKWMGADVPKKS